MMLASMTWEQGIILMQWINLVAILLCAVLITNKK